jgi:hypothetical protein
MNSFQKSVLIIAGSLLIIMLLILGYILYKKKHNTSYPPVIAGCPDYWVDTGSNKNGSNCKNIKNLGKETCQKEMNFSSALWMGNRGLCNKAKWAKTCDLTWDGITNNNIKC